MAAPWYATSYRRNLVDMHIEDWDASFLSRLDPRRYVELLRTARVQSAMVYANSHVGYCYWPTSSGRMHRGIAGRDMLGEILQHCHSAGIDVVVYYSVIFNNLAYDREPEWRLLDSSGEPSREGERFRTWLKPRYGICCPNNPGYREFVVTQLRELCAGYRFAGLFFDMNFWPDVCYCAHCRTRYRRETGQEIPLVVDWGEKNWCTFQAKREEWLAEMGSFVSSTAKRFKPGISTEHNFAQITINWEFGFTDRMLPACDYLGGDFYGSFAHGSFIARLLRRMSPQQPWEYMTSRCNPGLTFHTDTKPKQILQLTNYLALAHGGALLFIDAINLDGTQDPRVYALMGEVFAESMPYEEFLGGNAVEDVGVYFGVNSKLSPADNGTPVAEYYTNRGSYPHLEAAVGAARMLKEQHIPFGVVTKAGLQQLGEFRVLVLPDIYRLDAEEVAAITRFVAEGGSIYASGVTVSHFPDLFAVTVQGLTEEQFTYIAPVAGEEAWLPEVTAGAPLTVPGPQVLVAAADPASVKAHIALPFTKPKERAFASIHSNPPGKTTAHPALIHRSFGKGKAVWVSAPIEREERWVHAGVFQHLLRTLHPGPFRYSADAPAQVEVVVWDQPQAQRYVVHLVNLQERLPILPVYDLRVTLRLDGRQVRGARLAVNAEPLTWEQDAGRVTVEVPELALYQMLILLYIPYT